VGLVKKPIKSYLRTKTSFVATSPARALLLSLPNQQRVKSPEKMTHLSGRFRVGSSRETGMDAWKKADKLPVIGKDQNRIRS